MKFIYLSKDFYNKYPKSLYPEIKHKLERPYAQVVISLHNQLWAIPLCSHIKHTFTIWSDQEHHCGLDLSKAVPISSIDIGTFATIRQHEFNELKGKDTLVKEQFEAYIKRYKEAKKYISKYHNKILVEYSTLQYFEDYI